MALTSHILHKHYCENDVEGILAWFDDRFLWFWHRRGGVRDRHGDGQGHLPPVRREGPQVQYFPTSTTTPYPSPRAFTCAPAGCGSPPTLPRTVYLRVHQRVTMAYRTVRDALRLCHIHISNPYIEMMEGDVGFPTRVARQTYDYLQQCVEEQKRQIAEQTVGTAQHLRYRILRHHPPDAPGRRFTICSPSTARFWTYSACRRTKCARSTGRAASMTALSPRTPGRMAFALEALKAPGDVTHVDFHMDSRDGRRLCLTGTNTFISEDERGTDHPVHRL